MAHNGTSPLSPRAFQSTRPGPSTPQSYSQRNAVARRSSGDGIAPHINGQGINMGNKDAAREGEGAVTQLSPRNSLRRQASTSDTANSHFPLNNLDYESNPNAIAQELNNLSALRRMSMDVNASGDPDLPSFNSNFAIPAAPPAGTDPDDRARLYWVPASVHPELAPMEFKTFLDKKVKSFRRRSEEKQASLSPDGLQRDGSSASLRRRKSMLSRQIDNTDGQGAEGYQDGAERLDRRRSQGGGEVLGSGITNLQHLEALVNEPDKFLQRLSLENGLEGASAEVLPEDDVPILPAMPSSNNSLKRSTRTNRRGGSLRRGERAPFSKRAAQLGSDCEGDQVLPSPSSSPQLPSDEGFNLSRVQTEPTPGPVAVAENFSRPGRLNRRAAFPPRGSQTPSHEETPVRPPREAREQAPAAPQPRHFVSQIASNGRIGVPLGKQSNVPSIVETPPPSEESRYQPPERSSSHGPPPSMPPSALPPGTIPASRAHNWSPQSRTNQSIKPHQSLNDMTSHPSPLPGINTRTDSLSFIPTLTEDKKPDGKKQKDRKEKDTDGGRKSSWSWGSLLGNEEKDKEKRKEEEAKEVKKAKSRLVKQSDKSHDNTRLDLLQTAMEGTRGRESLVLDRGDLRLEEERKKESSRKSPGVEGKKEKETGFFSTLLGGGKKRGDRDSAGKKPYLRNLSPDPPMRILKPDIDYNWTRFSILEERAIYRMAHIKLANPRRALHSQVLLSNFMYSYLAKVQQMHPQANLPQSVAQRQQAVQQKKDQPEEFSQYQKYQESQQQQRQQHVEEERVVANAKAPTGSTMTLPQHQRQDNLMDMTYDYNQTEPDTGSRPQSRASQHPTRSLENVNGYASHQRRNQRQGIQHDPQQISPYAYQDSQFDEPDRGDDDMW
ncbi:MAG: hypothetical protein Q9163_004711 [Psora crenata]